MLYSISEIEKEYPNWYSKDSEMSRNDQQWMWENLPLPQEDKQVSYSTTIENAILSGSVNGIRKLTENVDENLVKYKEITNLANCNYRTTPLEISNYLTNIFGIWEQKPAHWLYIAQYYTPKTICAVLDQMIKTSTRGAVKLKSPPAYFTSVIKKYHKPRMALRKQNYDNS